MTNSGPKMFNFEDGRLVNKQIEEALQEAEDVLNLVDVLARATGNFINSCGKDEFSDNVSNWLFEKKQARTLSKAIRAGKDRCEQPEPVENASCSSRNGDCLEQMRCREAEIRERIVQPQFCSSGSIDFQNLTSSYYTSQLLSHHVSSDNVYKSARSRYLDQESAQISQIRSRLSRLNSAPASTRSACELVGPISNSAQPAKSKSPSRSAGVKMTLGAGSYANLSSCIAKSKSMFEDFASPNNPNYKCPWERRGRSHRCDLRRH